MNIQSVIGAIALCAVSASAHAALLGRDLDGNAATYEAYYDTVLDITWLADANLAASSTFGVAGISSSPGTVGWMSWDTANAWIAAMNAANYLGIGSWRLPAMVDIDDDGCVDNFAMNGTDCGYNVVSVGPDASEMASLFYDTLGTSRSTTPMAFRNCRVSASEHGTVHQPGEHPLLVRPGNDQQPAVRRPVVAGQCLVLRHAVRRTASDGQECPYTVGRVRR